MAKQQEEHLALRQSLDGSAPKGSEAFHAARLALDGRVKINRLGADALASLSPMDCLPSEGGGVHVYVDVCVCRGGGGQICVYACRHLHV